MTNTSKQLHIGDEVLLSYENYKLSPDDSGYIF